MEHALDKRPGSAIGIFGVPTGTADKYINTEPHRSERRHSRLYAKGLATSVWRDGEFKKQLINCGSTGDVYMSLMHRDMVM